MSDFNTLCKKFENSDPAVLKDITTRKLESVYNRLMALPEKDEAVTIFCKSMMCLMLADGDFCKEEYDLIQTRMDTDILTDMDYEELRDFMMESNLNNPEERDRVISSMVGILTRLSEFDRDDIMLVALMVCGIDGDVSENEKAILNRFMITV